MLKLFRARSLARALLMDPDLMVLDEPAQGVDIIGQQELYRLIRQIKEQRGCSILMVSHDLHLVMASTDTVLCVNQHICCSGHPDKIGKDPAFFSLFGEPASEELAIYAHHHDHSHSPSGERNCSAHTCNTGQNDKG